MIENSFKSVDLRANQLQDHYSNINNNNNKMNNYNYNSNNNISKASFSYDLFAKFYTKFSRIHQISCGPNCLHLQRLQQRLGYYDDIKPTRENSKLKNFII